jgi:hypothetical protein
MGDDKTSKGLRKQRQTVRNCTPRAEVDELRVTTVTKKREDRRRSDPTMDTRRRVRGGRIEGEDGGGTDGGHGEQGEVGKLKAPARLL